MLSKKKKFAIVGDMNRFNLYFQTVNHEDVEYVEHSKGCRGYIYDGIVIIPGDVWYPELNDSIHTAFLSLKTPPKPEKSK